MPKKILITGASSGIGLATAELFAEKGWALFLNGRDPKRLDAAAKDLKRRFKADVTAMAFDVSDRKALEAALKTNAPSLADLDVLVNNAGFALGTELVQDADPEDWSSMIDTNVKGLLYVTRALLPGMIRRGRGHVVNLGSTAGHWAYRGGAVYNATKHAVRVINEALRLDVAGSGVRVSSVDPGLVETNFSVVRFKGDQERARKVYEGYTPLSARDVGECILWVVERPAHVNIQEMIVFPTDQAAVGVVHKRA